jgi:hypothetical protein
VKLGRRGCDGGGGVVDAELDGVAKVFLAGLGGGDFVRILDPADMVSRPSILRFAEGARDLGEVAGAAVVLELELWARSSSVLGKPRTAAALPWNCNWLLFWNSFSFAFSFS